MAKDLYIQDTCEVFITAENGDVVGVGYAQVSGLEISVDSTPVRGGIGNKLAYTIRSSKDLSLNITSATMKPEFLSIIQGGEWEVVSGTDEVTRTFVATVKEVVDAVTGTPTGDFEIELPTNVQTLNLTAVRLEDVDGVQQSVPVPLGTTSIELPNGFTAVKGDEIEVFYLKPVNGRKFDIKTGKYGAKYKIEYNTICYDRETETPHSELSFVFPQAVADGNMSMGFQNGEAWIPEMNFNVTTKKGSDVLGTKYEEIIAP